MSSIKLSTFMALYNAKKSEDGKIELIKQFIKNEYVPYEKKVSMANRIADIAYWQTETNADGSEIRYIHVDSTAKYMMTCMAMIDLFTNIERQKADGKMLEDFNLLNGSGAFDLILQNINQRELKEFNMILQLVCDDLITNEYENHAYISKQVNRFGKLIGASIAPILENLDMEQLINMIKDNIG